MLFTAHCVPYVRKFNLLSYANRCKAKETNNFAFKTNMKQKKINFNIKLLSGKTVVLIECDGYESEVFIPYISTEGRISIKNIIPNRRCCNFQQKESHANTTINNKQNIKFPKCDKLLKTTSLKGYLEWRKTQANKENVKKNSEENGVRLCGGEVGTINLTQTPLANSTPTKKARVFDTNIYDTPEQIRRMRPLSNTIEDSNPDMPLKTVYTSPTLRHIREHIITAQQINDITRGKVQKINSTKEVTATESFSIDLPQSPSLNPPQLSSATVPSPKTPQQPCTPKQADSNFKLLSESRWHKVRTPLYTYSRTKLFSGKKKIPTPLKKPLKVKSSYLANPTQCPKPLHNLEIKKRKIILDAKLVISPKSFKRQQGVEEITKASSRNTLKTRSAYQLSKEPAFDLLTNANRSQQISPKLNKLFRRGCVNKSASTNSKYKILASAPPLEKDTQVQLLEQSSQTSTK